MRTIHLPDSIYEHLPKVYLLLALLLLFTPLPAFKWLLIAALVVGTLWIKQHRRKFREERKLREFEATQRKYKAGRRRSLQSRSPLMVL